jgi:FkbM family methyltransferase
MRRAQINYNGKVLEMFYENPSDEVQKFIAEGSFYEEHVLRRHVELIPHGGTVLDVGSNIGNHAVYYANFSRASKVYCFEPNPVARRLLLANVETSGAGKVRLDFVEFGAGRKRSKLSLGVSPDNNLGGTSLAESSSGAEVQVVPLDEILANEPVDFIKIDVEGMELDVLMGATGIIRKYRPIIHVEVRDYDSGRIGAFISDMNYMIVDVFRQYRGVTDYIIIPNPALDFSGKLFQAFKSAIPRSVKAGARKWIKRF